MGLNTKRGDDSVAQMAFTKSATRRPPGRLDRMLGYAKYALIGIASALFLFFMPRALRRREQEGIEGQPPWLRELGGPGPLAELGTGRR